jgi:hypothetical protein
MYDNGQCCFDCFDFTMLQSQIHMTLGALVLLLWRASFYVILFFCNLHVAGMGPPGGEEN